MVSGVMRGFLAIAALICGALLTSALAEEWSVPDVDVLPMDARLAGRCASAVT